MRDFGKILLQWYHQHKRDLPWRRTKDPYKIWVSEIMLQQTTVNTVIGFYDRWLEAFPSVHHLAKAPLQAVLKQWQGLGYYNRAKNLHKAASSIINDHQGILPRDPQLVRLLPGFGPYTTGSVLSIAYDIPLTIIDANVRRVVMRLLALPGIADTKQDIKVNEFLLDVLPSTKVGDFNQALMELGALICKPREPLCIACPVKKMCKAFEQGKQEIIPETKKKVLKDIHAVIAVIKQGKKYLLQQRPTKGLLANMWEFPGGKIEKGEAKVEALRRELKEELDVELKSSKHLFEVKHFYTEFRVHLSVFDCQLKTPPPLNETRRWVMVKDFAKYPMPSGSAKIVEKLKLFS